MFCVFFMAVLVGCGFGTTITQKGPKYAPREGPAKMLWRNRAVLPDPSTYELLATIQRRTGTCGISPAMTDQDNHATIASEAGKLGADAVVIDCGIPGTTGECHCFGDAIRYRELPPVAAEVPPPAAPAVQTAKVCNPGASVACIDAKKKRGTQYCVEDGMAYGPCLHE